MSQSWDNVASMHDHLLTVVHAPLANSILPGQDCPLVPCACADWGGYRGHTPWQNKQLQLSVQWQRSRSARMLLPDYWQIWTDLASRFARSSVASASACLAGLSKCAELSRRSFDNASLTVAMARCIRSVLVVNLFLVTRPHAILEAACFGHYCHYFALRMLSSITKFNVTILSDSVVCPGNIQIVQDMLR